MSRFARKVDSNHALIIDALKAIGASVQSLHVVGFGAPDLLVGYRGANFALEVKDGAKVPSAQKLTPLEQVWHRQWRGHVAIVRTVDEALAAIGVRP